MSRVLRFRRRDRQGKDARVPFVERLKRMRDGQRKLHHWLMVAGAVALVGAVGWIVV